MNVKLSRKEIILILLTLLLGVLSLLFLGDKFSSAETYSRIISSIDESIENVLKLTASSTVASAGISAIPGDTATPIAEKLADFTEYFLIILCVLYAEKYLLTILGIAAFRILIPASCLLLIASIILSGKENLRKRALKIAVLGLSLWLVIPCSIKVSDMIYETYQTSIDSTVSSAESLSGETSLLTEASSDQSIIETIMTSLSETSSSLTQKASDVLNRFVETLAVMIATSCVIPLLVLLVFVKIIKTLC